MAVARILAVKQIFWEVFPSRITLENDKKVADIAVATATKPKMRGLLKSAIKRNIFTGLAISAASGIALKELVAEERKRKYAEYYRTHDAEKDFEEMRKKGVFQSC